MMRRLYFILPDASRAADIVQELQQSGVASRRIRLVTRRPEQDRIGGVALQDASDDPDARMEYRLWNLNLAIFFVALLGVVAVLVSGIGMVWVGIPLLIMLASFIAGERFTHLPNTHLREFASALRHGEMVLMVDVPPDRVAECETLIHQHHPEAAVGGVGWSSDLPATAKP